MVELGRSDKERWRKLVLRTAGVSCVGEKRRVIFEGCLSGVVVGGLLFRWGGPPSGAGVDIVPHEDPCVWVLPGSRPVGTPRLAGAIGAQLQVS